MAYSVRIYNCITPLNFVLKHNSLPRLVCCSFRNFCLKDNEISATSSDTKDSTSSENQKENSNKGPIKLRSKFKPKTEITEATKEAAKQKLKSLLSEITITSDSPDKYASKLNIARAVKRISKKERLERAENEAMTPEKKLKMAVKAIASNFKDDTEKVESELTERLSTLDLTKKETSAEEVEDSEKVEETRVPPLIDEQLSANLMSSVEEVAETITESPIPPRSELTKRLMRLSLDQKLKAEQKPVRSVIEGMVIKSQKPVDEKKTITERKMKKFSLAARKTKQIDLFGAMPLNIFEPDSESKQDSSSAFWQKLQEKELHLLTHFAPANAFEEMIMWTEQGKHWKFPIDNETEMGAEEKVGFHEHVFLEHHLKGFPTRGPIRHFMELVCVGLSKNPYITVERKIENIEWFRNYFKEKEDVLKEAGAIQ